jgi:hypothetical protein
MRIIGLDIGRGVAVACVLDGFPDNIQAHYKRLKKEKQFLKLTTDSSGVDKFLALNPDGIVLEPTGHWYSHFWVTLARKHDIRVFWMGHCDLDKQRGSYGFTNKRDEEDALCLTASYFDDRFIDDRGSKRFLFYYQNDLIADLREMFLEKEQLQKLRTNLISQLRQRLSFEFPEIARSSLTISHIRGFTPIVGWLAHCHQPSRIERKYQLSVAHGLGITISDYTIAHAKILVDIEQRIVERYDWLQSAISLPQFEPYLRVFDRFGFGIDNKALLLYHCYPFEKFLIDGRRWIEYEENQKGKIVKRDRSLRKFQAFMGLSYSYKQSGSTTKRKFHGSSMVRSHLYVWAVCMVAPNSYRISSSIGKQLSDRYRELKVTVKGKDALIRILFKATRMLFYELLSEFS